MKKLLIAAIILVSIVALGLAAWFWPKPPPEVGPEPIRIGIIGPFKLHPGISIKQGAIMAAEEINAQGGVLLGGIRRPIKLFFGDTEMDASGELTKATAERLITVDKVQFLVGMMRTEMAFIVQDVAAEHRVIYLSTGPAHPELTKRVLDDYLKYKYYFRITPVNSTELAKVIFALVELVAHNLRQELGIKELRAAILAEKMAWADPIVDAAQKLLPKKNISVVGVWRPSPFAIDLYAELTDIRAKEPHLIFTVMAGPVGIVYGKQWGELKIPAASVGVNAEAQKLGFWKATEGYGNYEFTPNSYGRAPVTELSIPFWDKYLERWKEYPTTFSGSYWAIKLLVNVIQATNTTDPDKLVEYLERVRFRGASGTMAFGPDHDLLFDINDPGKYITPLGTQWQDGELVVVWPPQFKVKDYRIPPWVIEYWSARK